MRRHKIRGSADKSAITTCHGPVGHETGMHMSSEQLAELEPIRPNVLLCME